MWITNSLQADWMCLLANTSEGAAHKNKSLIMVPMNAKGVVKDYSDLARLGGVSRARITQIMNLLHLATPIQEEILSWSQVEKERDPVSERALRRLTRIPMWSKQLELWRRLAPANHASNAATGRPVDLSRV